MKDCSDPSFASFLAETSAYWETERRTLHRRLKAHPASANLLDCDPENRESRQKLLRADHAHYQTLNSLRVAFAEFNEIVSQVPAENGQAPPGLRQARKLFLLSLMFPTITD